jgi:hypothetical protein
MKPTAGATEPGRRGVLRRGLKGKTAILVMLERLGDGDAARTVEPSLNGDDWGPQRQLLDETPSAAFSSPFRHV